MFEEVLRCRADVVVVICEPAEQHSSGVRGNVVATHKVWVFQKQCSFLVSWAQKASKWVKKGGNERFQAVVCPPHTIQQQPANLRRSASGKGKGVR